MQSGAFTKINGLRWFRELVLFLVLLWCRIVVEWDVQFKGNRLSLSRFSLDFLDIVQPFCVCFAVNTQGMGSLENIWRIRRGRGTSCRGGEEKRDEGEQDRHEEGRTSRVGSRNRRGLAPILFLFFSFRFLWCSLSRHFGCNAVLHAVTIILP